MGKDSLIKSTTKKKPAAEKEDKTQQVKKVSTKAKKTAPAKSDTKPKKKTVKTKTAAPKKPAVETTATKTVKKKQAPKKSASSKKPVKTPAAEKPLPVAEPSHATRTTTKPEPAAEPSPPVAPSAIDHTPPPDKKPADPAEKMLYIGGAGIVLLILIVIIASWMNTQHYYIETSEGAVDIWQGKFAPKGARLLMSVPGLELAQPTKDSYSADEVFPIIHQFYLDKADMLLDVPGMPDFDGVKAYLDKSLSYATTREMKTVIENRLDAINLMVLLFKADVAASKNSLETLETAMGYLKEAQKYQMDELESARVKQKADAVRKKIEDLKTAATKAVEGEDGN